MRGSAWSQRGSLRSMKYDIRYNISCESLEREILDMLEKRGELSFGELVDYYISKYGIKNYRSLFYRVLLEIIGNLARQGRVVVEFS